MPKRYKKKRKIEKVLMFIVTSSLLFLMVVYFYNTYQGIEIESQDYKVEKISIEKQEDKVEEIKEESKNISEVLEETIKSVVGISKLKNNGTSIFTNNNEESLGIGTGIIVSEKGYILSNKHVSGEQLSVCYITLEDGKKYEGTVVWSDNDLDLSIIKINKNNLPSIKLGNSSEIKIGEKVYAIGNPIGFEFRRTVTSGIISSINRSIKIEENTSSYMSDLIQTDATINPGNSGGPLIYPNGEVIGVNTIKISSAEGIGFAIPINVIKPIIESFNNSERFEQATLGIYAYDKAVVPYLDNNINFSEGIYVAQITKNGPSDNSGLKEGDIITSIDNKKLNTMNDLREYIYTKKPGENVLLKVFRGRANMNINIILR